MIDIIKRQTEQDDFWKNYPKELEALTRRLLEFGRNNTINNEEKYAQTSLNKEKERILKQQSNKTKEEVGHKIDPLWSKVNIELAQLSKQDKFLSVTENVNLVKKILDKSRVGNLSASGWYNIQNFHIPFAIEEAKRIDNNRNPDRKHNFREE